ncbi:MAG: rod shape-determining protein MreD [Jatrophihabitans sp.]|uniref:rod shape-determining protein MreD n=1 Tax=Jatrophihabitans sp. TaxID=1932789 RepID=UPI003F7F28C1
MNRARYLAAGTVALTILLLQATLVTPVAHTVPVSLPAVLVAAVALQDGAGTGLTFGFVVGLLADLGSPHPAGVLALAYMAVGLVCGTVTAWHSIPRGALVSGVTCGAATAAATALLAVLGRNGASFETAVLTAVPAAIVDGLLALLLIPLARRFLRTDSLRAPAPVLSELTSIRAGGGVHEQSV